jgi:hypothetical protein
MPGPDPSQPFSLPLTIGVTGHRNLAAAHEGRIEAAVVSVLGEIRRQSPGTPLLVLTALAEGADRLVARIAAAQFDAGIVAVLPQPAAEYRKSFGSDESRAAFDALLATARHVVIPAGKANGEAPCAGDEAARRRLAYARAGGWVAHHAHVLIALWDGDRAQGKGGTAEIVDAKRRGRYAGLDDAEPLQCDEAGAIAHIVTAREGTAAPAGVCDVRWIFTEAAEHGRDPGRGHKATLYAFGMLNALCRKERSFRQWSDEEMASLQPMGTTGDVLPDVSHLAALRAVAARHARTFQGWTHLAAVGLAVAPIATAIFAMLEPVLGSTAATALNLAILACGYLTWLVAQRYRLQRKYLDFRALAEGGRVQLAWMLSGLPHPVADHYHPAQAHAVDWIRRALRTAWMLDRLERGVAPAIDPASGARAALAWIEGQRAYLLGDKGVVARFRRQGRLFKLLAVACMVVGIAIGVGGRMLGYIPGDTCQPDRALLVSVASFVLALAGAVKAYQAFMGFEDLERSFVTSGHLFTMAKDECTRASEAGDAGRVAAIALALGRAALVENTGWLLLKRQRLLKPPGKGD